MGIIRKQAARNSMISYIGIVLGYVNITILFPRLLGAELFGLTQVLISVATIASNFGSFGMQHLVIRYFPRFRQKFSTESNPFPLLIFLIFFIGSGLTSLILWTFQEEIYLAYEKRAPLFNEHFLLIYPLTVFSILSITLDSIGRSFYKTEATAIFKEVVLRILQLIIVVCFAFGLLDTNEFLLAFTAMIGLYSLMMAIYIFRINEFKLNLTFSGINRAGVWDMTKYSVTSLLALTANLTGHVETIILGSMAGLSKTAVYAVAAAIGSVISVPGRSVNRIANAVIADAWARKDLRMIDRIYKKGAINNIILGGFIAMLAISNAENFLSLLPETYENGLLPLIVLCIARLVGMSFGVNGGIIQSSDYYRMNFVINVTNLALNVGLNILLIGRFGILGAALSELASNLYINIFRYVFLKVKFGFSPYQKSLMMVILWLAFVTAVAYFIPSGLPVYLDAPIRGLVFGSAYIAVIYRAQWSKDFNELVDSIIHRVRRTFRF